MQVTGPFARSWVILNHVAPIRWQSCTSAIEPGRIQLKLNAAENSEIHSSRISGSKRFTFTLLTTRMFGFSSQQKTLCKKTTYKGYFNRRKLRTCTSSVHLWDFLVLFMQTRAHTDTMHFTGCFLRCYSGEVLFSAAYVCVFSLLADQSPAISF